MSEKYNESNPSIEQKPSRRQFIKRMFETGTTLIAGSIAGSEKLAGQDHPEKYYEGLDQNVVNEMKAVDKLTGDVKKADEIKQSKIKELLELWGQKK